jgi:hypothetical protein
MKNPVLKSTDLLYSFLNIPDYQTFEKKKKEITKIPAPQTVEEIKHFGGNVTF